MRDEIIDWAQDKHDRMLNVIPVANEDPWSLHGPETVCTGCLQLFVGGYLSDIPDVFRMLGQDDEISGI